MDLYNFIIATIKKLQKVYISDLITPNILYAV